MSLSYVPHFGGLAFKVWPALANLDHKHTVSAYLESDHLQNGITQLNLESDGRLNTLTSFLKRGFKRGAKTILSKPSNSEQAEGIYTAKEDIMVTDVANMLDLAVGKHLSEHPEELQNAEARLRHRTIAARIFVEIFYEVSTGSDGGFTAAFLSKKLRALVAQVAAEQPVSAETQKKVNAVKQEFEALLKKKDNEIRKLKAEKLPIEQLLGQIKRAEMSIDKLTFEKRTVMARLQSKTKEYNELELQVDPEGVNTMRTQLARAQSALQDAKSEIEELKESLALEKLKNKDIAEAEETDLSA